jgi:hypothetical protein
VFKHYLVSSVKVHIQLLGTKNDKQTFPRVSFSDHRGCPVKGTAHLINRSSSNNSLDFSVLIQEIESPDLTPVPRDSIHYEFPRLPSLAFNTDTMRAELEWSTHALWPNYDVQLPPSPPLFYALDDDHQGTFISSPKYSPQMVIHPVPGVEFPAKVFLLRDVSYSPLRSSVLSFLTDTVSLGYRWPDSLRGLI